MMVQWLHQLKIRESLPKKPVNLASYGHLLDKLRLLVPREARSTISPVIKLIPMIAIIGSQQHGKSDNSCNFRVLSSASTQQRQFSYKMLSRHASQRIMSMMKK